MVTQQLNTETYIQALNELNNSYDLAEKLEDTELMLEISLMMEKLIDQNNTNEIKLRLQ